MPFDQMPVLIGLQILDSKRENPGLKHNHSSQDLIRKRRQNLGSSHLRILCKLRLGQIFGSDISNIFASFFEEILRQFEEIIENYEIQSAGYSTRIRKETLNVIETREFRRSVHRNVEQIQYKFFKKLLFEVILPGMLIDLGGFQTDRNKNVKLDQMRLFEIQNFFGKQVN